MSERKQVIIAAIDDARGDLVDLARSLDEALLVRPTCNEGWCVKDVLAHLAGSEAGLRRYAELACKGEPSARPGFDLHAHNERQVEMRRGRSVEELLAEMAENRVATLSFLEALPEDRLDVMGSLASGLQLTVEQIFSRIASHERVHAGDIRKALQG